MKNIWEETGASLRLAAEQMKHFYDCHRKDAYPYKPGDKVWLEGYNLQTDRPSKKLSDKCYGPFTILSKIGTAAYKLKLPRTWKSIWPVFNELLLTPYKEPANDSQRHPPPPPPPEIIEDQEEYEVNEIHDSKLVCGKLRYLVEWFGYPERHEWTWEPASNVKNAPLKVKEFHRNHPSALRPVQLKEFTFIPIQNFTEPSVLNIPSWIDGKELADPWQHTCTIITETPITPIDENNAISVDTDWTASPIDNWNLLDPSSNPPSQFNNEWPPLNDTTPWDSPKSSPLIALSVRNRNVHIHLLFHQSLLSPDFHRRYI